MTVILILLRAMTICSILLFKGLDKNPPKYHIDSMTNLASTSYPKLPFHSIFKRSEFQNY